VAYAGETPTRDELAAALRAEGVPVNTGMSAVSNTLRTELISRKRYYPLTDETPAFWRDTAYDPDSCPNVDRLQQTVLRLPVDQRYTDEDIEQTIAAVRKVWAHYFG
jgi:dTDP-4-amino-4,6-dideoxygalactose transaminase